MSGTAEPWAQNVLIEPAFAMIRGSLYPRHKAVRPACPVRTPNSNERARSTARRSPNATEPYVLLVRGRDLNRFEMQPYEALAGSGFPLVAVGTGSSPHQQEGMDLPVVRLHLGSDLVRPAALARRLGHHPGDSPIRSTHCSAWRLSPRRLTFSTPPRPSSRFRSSAPGPVPAVTSVSCSPAGRTSRSCTTRIQFSPGVRRSSRSTPISSSRSRQRPQRPCPRGCQRQPDSGRSCRRLGSRFP